MTYILYGIPNCNTVKKARVWLEEKGIPFQFHNFKKDGLTKERLEIWLQQEPHEKLINRAGMTFRKLSDEEKAAITNNEAAIALMLEKTSVIKRPILELEDKVLALGFKEGVYEGVVE